MRHNGHRTKKLETYLQIIDISEAYIEIMNTKKDKKYSLQNILVMIQMMNWWNI